MNPPTLDRESRLDDIIADYLERIENGQRPDRQQLLRDHPDLAEDLRAFFADQEQFDNILAPLSSPRLPIPHSQAATKAFPRRPVTPPPFVGQRIGEYQILEQIARGGMGVVFKARHIKLNRDVALKMILTGQLATQEQVQRFQLETEAVARLDHPNIIPIYEVGEFQGWYYYTMKLIQGQALGPALFENIGPDRYRHMAHMMSLVARAVHHAHLRGVLHRDLKPANILLDGDGQPYVTDFGLAKNMSESNVPEPPTPSGTTVGTPSYMAPEQAVGPKLVTTAVDVYSLGAILYELLTGKPPFRADTPLATMLEVIDHKPATPSQLVPTIPRDINTICLKCLEKAASARYFSASDLADDLDRFVKGEPIVARPATFLETTLSWARRDPKLASVGFVLFLVFVGWLVTNHWQHRRVQENFELAQKNLARLQAQEAETQKLFDRAKSAIDEFCNLTERRLGDYAFLADFRQEMLQIGLKYYRDFLEEKGKDPSFRREVAKTHFRRGLLLIAVQSRGDAIVEFDRARGIYDQLLEDDPKNVDTRFDKARALKQMAHLLVDMGQVGEGLQRYQETADIFEALAIENPDRGEFPSEKARVLRSLGDYLRRQGQIAQAQKLLSQSLLILDRQSRKDPKDRDLQLDLAETFNILGHLQAMTMKNAEAVEYLRRGIKVVETLAEQDANNLKYQSLLGVMLCTLGVDEIGSQPLDIARHTLEQAAGIQEKLAQANPKMPQLHRDLAFTYRHLGHTWLLASDIDKAQDYYDKALEKMLETLKSQRDSSQHKHELALCYMDKGVLESRRGDFNAALKAFRQAEQFMRENMKANPGDIAFRQDAARTFSNLALALRDLKRYDESRDAWNEAETQLVYVNGVAPQVPRNRELLAEHYFKRAAMEARLGRDADVQKWIDARRGLVDKTPAGLLSWAQGLAQLAAIGATVELKEKCAVEAMKALVKLQESGFRDAAKLRSPAFDALRQRDDFMALMKTF